jgi:hypothetical protein
MSYSDTPRNVQYNYTIMVGIFSWALWETKDSQCSDGRQVDGIEFSFS